MRKIKKIGSELKSIWTKSVYRPSRDASVETLITALKWVAIILAIGGGIGIIVIYVVNSLSFFGLWEFSYGFPLSLLISGGMTFVISKILEKRNAGAIKRREKADEEKEKQTEYYVQFLRLVNEFHEEELAGRSTSDVEKRMEEHLKPKKRKFHRITEGMDWRVDDPNEFLVPVEIVHHTKEDLEKRIKKIRSGSDPDESKPLWLRWWVWVLAIILIFVLIRIIGGGCSSHHEPQQPQPTETTSTSNGNDNSNAVNPMQDPRKITWPRASKGLATDDLPLKAGLMPGISMVKPLNKDDSFELVLESDPNVSIVCSTNSDLSRWAVGVMPFGDYYIYPYPRNQGLTAGVKWNDHQE